MTFFRCILTVLMIVTVSIVHAQSVKKPAKKPVAKPKNIAPDQLSNTLLWQISGNGLKQPSYLFGTMHVLCAEDAKLSESLKGVIRKTVKVYFEVDMDNLPEMMGAMKYMRMNDGIKISDLLTKEEYARLETFLKNSKSPMPISMINRFKPYLVSGLLSEQSMKCEKKNGMEELIMKEASLHDKEIFGLESVQFQASLFDSIPYEKQAKDLIKYIDSADSYQNSTQELVDVYLKQDLKRMDSLVSKSDPGMEDYMDLLLYDRNRRWVFQMPGIMMEGTLLFAVGAGHLTGEKGLISLLRKKGFKVTPVANQWNVTRETTIEKKESLIDKRVENGNERVDMTDKRVMKKILGYKKFVSGIKRTHAGFHLITILLLVQSAGAQQLIFNGSFEDVNICDEYQAPCSPSAWFYMNKTGSIGYSRQGELGAKEQNRYLRLLVVRYDTLTRQYWETSLAAKMEVGKRYKASFRIFDENGPNLNDIGFYFGNSFILSWQDSLLQPENYIAFTDAKPKRLKNGWYLIEKEFVATTNGEVLIIGNFSGLSNTEILRNRNLIGRKLYIALDDLSIVCLEANAVSTDPLKKDSLYGLTRRHYILPPKPAAKGKANPLKIPVIVDDIEPKIDTIRLSNIEFAFNKHTLKNVSILESYRSQFTRNDIDHINVIGFTDSSGTQKYNNELSIKRAGEIAWLIQSRFGIGAAVIKYEGRGESVQYKDDSMNRRVEIFIYYK